MLFGDEAAQAETASGIGRVVWAMDMRRRNYITLMERYFELRAPDELGEDPDFVEDVLRMSQAG